MWFGVLQDIFFHVGDVLTSKDLQIGQQVWFEFAFEGKHGLQAKNIRLKAEPGSQVLTHPLDPVECKSHLDRRKHEEFVRSLFQTGFWKYPTSLETQPKSDGGEGLNFHPFVKDEKFSRHTLNLSESSKTALVDNGPDLDVKTSRKPWLKDGKIMPYLIKSPSRFPLQVPCGKRGFFCLHSPLIRYSPS
jgi:hypothetical protein